MLEIAEFIVCVVGASLFVFVYLPFPRNSRPIGDPDCERQATHTHMADARTKRSAFRAYRLTSSTFVVIEVNDIYSEHPYIYAKVVPEAGTILVLDTGCGGVSNDPDVDITSLREFLETVPVEANGWRPINQGGCMGYIVVLSHCHYDHILGVEQFANDSPILESSHSPDFVSQPALPVHSLCQNLGIRTPQFTPILVPHNAALHAASGVPLGITLLHTPGHTPDELALWDANELMLYVGDTLYEWEPIIFPKEGDIRVWLGTIDELVNVVVSSQAPEAVKINCGHRTAARPALEVLRATKQFIMNVLMGKEQVRWKDQRGGEMCVEYRQEGGRFSLRCPERLVQEARRYCGCWEDTC